MDVVKALRYFSSKDGPHIVPRILAIYCGINENTMKDYIRGRSNPPEETRKQIARGLTDMMKEMLSEWPI